MRAFTPEVDEALRWFRWCYRVNSVPRFEPWCLPAPGGAGDQDARLTQALDCLADVHNAMLREAIKRREGQPHGDRDNDD